MPATRRKLLLKFNKIFDITAVAFSFAVTSLLAFMEGSASVPFQQFLSTRVKISNILILLVLFFGWQLSFRLVGLYRSRRLSTRFQETIDILKVTTVSTFLLLAAGFVFDISLIDKSFLFTFWTISSLILIASRIVLYTVLKNVRRHGRNTRQMVIIGTGERAQVFARKVKQSPELGYNITGFIDDPWSGFEQFNSNGWKYLGDLSAFQEILRRTVIDEVVLSLPVKSYYDKISAIINICEQQGIIVRFLSDIFDLKIARSYVDNLDGTPLLTLHTVPVEQWSLLVKRTFDVAISSISLLLLLPLFLLVSVLIKLDSRGPVFFIQERVGLNKRRFLLLKFRTMVQNAENLRDQLAELNEVSGPVFKIKHDPRLTHVGKWLRRLSIDELPQLINVLIGDMSLVGPRPPIPTEVEQYRWRDRRRLSMKPGITCLWQVNGRSNCPFEKWMELDKEYIDNWSLWLDFKILAKTIPAVIRGSGAA
jgi:exopolysaccharide biosynthesis polyprenyl glycosylphosphotransferase